MTGTGITKNQAAWSIAMLAATHNPDKVRKV